MDSSGKSLSSLPRRLIVSLQMGGPYFALANVICVAILAYAWISVKHPPKTLEVKGSARKTIVSDTICWDGIITARDPDLTKAYEKIQSDMNRVVEFLRAAGIPEREITVSAIATRKIFQREAITGSDGPSRPMIVESSKVEMYVLTQAVRVESHDMQKVPEVARSVTSLIKDAVEIESPAPQYLYSKLGELKIDMLGEATRDATARAQQIVGNANGHLGGLVEARMGVMQINPKGVVSVSDSGNNDVTSLEKDVMAVVTARFELR